MSAICVSIKEAADQLGVSAWTVRQYIARGVLPAIKFPSTAHRGEANRRVLIAVSDLEKFVGAHREQVPQ